MAPMVSTSASHSTHTPPTDEAGLNRGAQAGNGYTTADLTYLQPQPPLHVPRAWEREPKSPSSTRHTDHEVWKRYNLRSEQDGAVLRNGLSMARKRGCGGVPQGHERASKKRCLGAKLGVEIGGDQEDNGDEGQEEDTPITSEDPQASTEAAGPTRDDLGDETATLIDFLQRVKAKRVAKRAAYTTEGGSPAKTPSPPKALRAVLGTVDANVPSPAPMKAQDTAAAAEETSAEPVPSRPKGTGRVGGPPRRARVTPSVIPLRRPEAAVVLRKSEAQELALLTRANTRRNKGRSKPADVTLKGLFRGAAGSPEEEQGSPPLKTRREGSKTVAWDEAVLGELEGARVEKAEGRTGPKGRKTRRRGGD